MPPSPTNHEYPYRASIMTVNHEYVQRKDESVCPCRQLVTSRSVRVRRMIDPARDHVIAVRNPGWHVAPRREAPTAAYHPLNVAGRVVLTRPVCVLRNDRGCQLLTPRSVRVAGRSTQLDIAFPPPGIPAYTLLLAERHRRRHQIRMGFAARGGALPSFIHGTKI